MRNRRYGKFLSRKILLNGVLHVNYQLPTINYQISKITVTTHGGTSHPFSKANSPEETVAESAEVRPGSKGMVVATKSSRKTYKENGHHSKRNVE